jgi:hypothetical protein
MLCCTAIPMLLPNSTPAAKSPTTIYTSICALVMDRIGPRHTAPAVDVTLFQPGTATGSPITPSKSPITVRRTD